MSAIQPVRTSVSSTVSNQNLENTKAETLKGNDQLASRYNERNYCIVQKTQDTNNRVYQRYSSREKKRGNPPRHSLQAMLPWNVATPNGHTKYRTSHTFQFSSQPLTCKKNKGNKTDLSFNSCNSTISIAHRWTARSQAILKRTKSMSFQGTASTWKAS